MTAASPMRAEPLLLFLQNLLILPYLNVVELRAGVVGTRLELLRSY